MSKPTAQSHGRPLRSALRLILIRVFLRVFAALPLRICHAMGTGLGLFGLAFAQRYAA